ncbi:zf-PARP-domain-containing protein [Dacryopinax primogenitus]|uniref:Zf-PARP-domain-containing protein n=1 Tax=Dacryopinax primogenitus (strain DJM 731) TaxID=1858805 RepID=M5FTJ1_DACPD|nr:zf-PARP-domain-containing protein [Dacryopinax primogenitus]EJT99408.1 zf-PARP-domain-containing protein [Dacryopinax primogenitus]
MSDEEGPGRKTAYRIEYASSARSKCKGPKPCSGSPIAKGIMRVGTLVDIKGIQSFQWRHFGCVTDRFMGNILKSVGEIEELDGYEDLKLEDQEKVKKAFETRTIEPEDIPESAKKPEADGEGEEEEKPKKKRTTKKTDKDEEEGEPKKKRATKKTDKNEEEEEPKKKRETKKKAKDEDEEDEPPKKRVRKAKPKKKDEDEDEDEEPEYQEEDDDDEEDEEEEKPKKRAKKAAAKPADKAKTGGRKVRKTARLF